MTLYDYCIAFDRIDLLEQWSKDKNRDISVNEVTHGSHKKVWWQCEKGHEWEVAIYCRTGSHRTGCPYCAGKKIDANTPTLETKYPALMKEWHPQKNLGLQPSEVLPSSHRKVWWICKFGHEWQAQVNSRIRGSGCPACANRKIIPGENDLATTHPLIAKEWHPRRNEKLSPQQVFAGTLRRVWWQCEKGHEWLASIGSRTSQDRGCPVCAGKVIIPGENDLATVFPELAKQWHPEKNDGLSPQAVFPYSNRKVWWQCKKGHAWKAAPGARAGMKFGCPYCTGRKVLAGFNDLATTHPKIAEQWHATLNESLTPQMVTPGSNKKVWWQCQDGHVWKAVVYSRTGPRQHGCPVCAGVVKASER